MSVFTLEVIGNLGDISEYFYVTVILVNVHASHHH
jgi:hypothetical protein